MHALDERLVDTICALDARGFSYADIRRALLPVARRAGVAPPSSTTVRRVAITERAAAEATSKAVDQIAAKLLQGRVPTVYELDELREARLA